ncbi:nucleotidyltransferase family protein [Nocardioides marmoribigeumensis]|jgi:CTP:molybdopterin cytidylyltransferase MocA|uniref:CTP:molybdopterin cytidylyltransferase MocA n=1 Tax=Nocardioides marmoribigeumensis TaxID=433649 RepID=A0ABU2BSJ5_9ACTN|nr:nucleotidyltransferase family protein [Nocardioides marmoribigeumensis]MDR7361602.1 CTP:molybdopterin cytidylyltransferase MocA [Nocardioides marmoribigeumensis]
MTISGLVLAAGQGRRMGVPKALLHTDGETWANRAVRLLLDGGCHDVLVVTGAAHEEVEEGLPEDDRVSSVHAPRWDEGMGESLRTGLDVLLHGSSSEAALVTLVDLPDLEVPVVERVLERWAEGGEGHQALLRATYDGRPGHPVLLGRAHWRRLLDVVRGDVGAQRYFDLEDDHGPRRNLVEVDCTDLASGRDVDLPEEMDT